MSNDRRGTAFGRLSAAARWVLGVVGLGLLGAGALAVFWTDNTTGMLALFAGGALLLITALIGLLPSRIKVGEHEVAYAEQSREALEAAITRPDSGLEERRTISDLIVGFHEQFMRQVGIVPESGRDLAILAYRISILAALRRALPRAQITELPRNPGMTDFIVKLDSIDIHVGYAAGLRTTSQPMPREILDRYIEHAESVGRLLVVTNRPPEAPTYRLSDSGGHAHFDPRPLPANIEIVKWTSPDDDRAIAESITRLLRL